MNVIRLVEIFPKKLLATVFEGTNKDEYTNTFNQWKDPEYLDSFFHEHRGDLESGFYDSRTIRNAGKITIQEAQEFQELLLNACEEEDINLENCFIPLSEVKIDDFIRQKNNSYGSIRQKSKAHGIRFKSWLRLYAIRLGTNLFVISGGAIKLTKKMNDREHLKKELKKLEILTSFLKEKEIGDFDDYGYIDFDEELWN